MAKFDRALVIEAIRHLSTDGNMPKAEDYMAHSKKHDGLCAYNTVVRRMGSWGSIAEALGLRWSDGSGWTNDELIELAKNLSELTAPYIIPQSKWDKIKPKGAPTASAVRIRFGGWREFSEDCGLQTRWNRVEAEPSSSTNRPTGAVRTYQPMINEAFLADNYQPMRKS